MIRSRRSVLTTVAGLAAAALAAPALAGDNRGLLQVADARATAPNFVGITNGSIRRRSRSVICGAGSSWSISGPMAATTASTRCPT